MHQSADARSSYNPFKMCASLLKKQTGLTGVSENEEQRKDRRRVESGCARRPCNQDDNKC